MKLIATALLLILASCSAVAPATQNASSTRDNRISLYLGQRNLEEDDWEPVDEQGTFGLEYSREPVGSPIGFEVGIMGSSDEDDDAGHDFEGTTAEIYGGVRKTFGQDVVRPYIGGGLSFINATADIDGPIFDDDDDDSSVGAYLHGGVGFQLSEMFTLGIDLRFLIGSDVTLFGEDVEADYGQFSLTFGFAF